MKTRKFDSGISIIRVIAMLSIVFGHICTWMDINLYQMGGIGVEIFLLISGYLYGEKEINSKAKWLGNRIQKVMMPFWILAICLSGYMFFCGDVFGAVGQLLVTGLDLQGIGRIFLYPFGIGQLVLPGLMHCWFLTVIMVCYLLTVLLKGSKAEQVIDDHLGRSLAVALLLQLALVFAGIQLSYILQYFLGYFYCRWKQRKGSSEKELFIWLTILTAIACAVRLLTRRYIDGTTLYDHFIARASFNVLGFWLFFAMSVLCKWFSRQTDWLASSWLWKKLDLLSYPIFLVHYMFMKAPFAMNGFVSATWGQICAALGLTLVSALVLHGLTVLLDRCFVNPKKTA